MGTIAEKLTAVASSKENMRLSIINKGVDCPADTLLSVYDDKIAEISGGAVLGTKNITANGEYNASADGYDGYSTVLVTVDSPTPSCPVSLIALTTCATAVIVLEG